MIDEQARPLRGAALYNPHLLSKAELVELFQVRHALLDRLVADLRSTPADRPPQHHLVIGQRGMGKTMLLHRLAYAIEDDPDLSQRWVPLTFPEEQYNVAHLSDFWLNCLDALSDRLDRTGQRDVAADLDERIEALRKVAEKDRSREALGSLLKAARRLGRRVALLVDNVDLVFDRISAKEEWAFRDPLSHESAIAFIGASAAAGEVTYDHGRAFYDFFQVHELGGLSLDETRALLLHYAEVWSEPVVAEIVERHHARLRTLHTLTGGNPRTVVLLFNVLARGMGGEVRTDLEQLLDQCTPLYKARFEALPEQAQRVVHALAIHWDPISAGELAREMRLKVNLVSAQLNRLAQQGVVEKVAYHPPTKTGFQIAERFFNIWYLMRASRRVRRRLIWLVEFLRLYYSQEELEERAQEHMRAMDEVSEPGAVAGAEMAFALANAVENGPWALALEDVGLRKLIESPVFRRRLEEIIDIERAEPSLRCRTDYLVRYQKLRDILARCSSRIPAEFSRAILTTPSFSFSWREAIVEGLERMDALDLADFRRFSKVDRKLRGIIRRYAGPLERLVSEAVERGDMLAYDDIHGAITTERKRGIPGLYITALLVMSIRYFLAIRVRASGNPEMVATPEWSGGAEDQKAAFCFLGALSAGGSDGAILFVESFGVNEYLRPLRAALEAAATNRGYLRRLAPEVRRATEEILKELDQGRQMFEANTRCSQCDQL